MAPNCCINPMHPYTKALIDATPVPNPKLARTKEAVVVKGEVPSPIDPPLGCRFHPRCPNAKSDCSKIMPELKKIKIKGDHFVACHL